jgi:GTP-binding protein YchF
MSLACGLVGLPNVGKSTLFNAILKKALAAAENYPFCTREPNVGQVPVPDLRLSKLAEISKSEKIVPALLTCVDIAGLIRGAHKGEGLGNEFLGNIRQVDLIIHVVRCFKGNDIIHVDGSIDPLRDYETICLELQLTDLNKIDNLLSQKKGLDSKIRDLYIEARNILISGGFLSSIKWDEEAIALFETQGLLTQKPMIVIANMETPEDIEYYKKIEHLDPIKVSASLENSLLDLESEEDRKMLLSEYGFFEDGLSSILRTAFEKLSLISFLTTGKQESRAWKVKKGSTMQKAAGKIHTDFEKGFISADVVSYDDFIKANGWVQAKELGLLRTVSKGHIVEDGDICLFKTFCK